MLSLGSVIGRLSLKSESLLDPDSLFHRVLGSTVYSMLHLLQWYLQGCLASSREQPSMLLEAYWLRGLPHARSDSLAKSRQLTHHGESTRCFPVVPHHERVSAFAYESAQLPLSFERSVSGDRAISQCLVRSSAVAGDLTSVLSTKWWFIQVEQYTHNF